MLQHPGPRLERAFRAGRRGKGVGPGRVEGRPGHGQVVGEARQHHMILRLGGLHIRRTGRHTSVALATEFDWLAEREG